MKIYLDYTKTKSITEKGYLKLKERFNEFVWTDKLEDSYDADVILVMPTFPTNETLEKYPNLKWIQLLTAGFDGIDFKYLESRGIKLNNANDVFSIAIAEDVLSKMLYFNKNMHAYDQNKTNKVWQSIPVTHEIQGSTVGILGVGSIGVETAKRLKAFNTKTLGYRRSSDKNPFFDKIYTDQAGLEVILKESDYIILALPSNKYTDHIINKDTLALMKKDAVLINVGRGSLINEDDLIKALENNELRGASLDVTEVEPLPSESKLWSLPNVFISPHTSNLSPHTEKRLVERLTINIESELR